MSKFKSNVFTHEGVNLHYVEAGQGPLVIFYHGFPSFWYSFHHQMTALLDRFHVVALDGPGINAFIFANIYKIEVEVTASAILICTPISIFSSLLWISIF